jgi:hypothetical protein
VGGKVLHAAAEKYVFSNTFFIIKHNCFMNYGSPRSQIPFFLLTSFYRKKFCLPRGHRRFSGPWGASLQYWVSITLADANNRTLFPVD